MTATDVDRILLEGRAHQAAGRLREAEEAYRLLLESDRNSIPGIKALAEILRKRGEIRGALDVYRRLIEVAAGDADAQFGLAVACHAAGEFADAVTAYRAALAIEPDKPSTYNNMGAALLDLGAIDEATEAHRRAIALRSDYPEAHYNLGNTLGAGGRTDEAIASYRRAIALRPDYLKAFINLGTALMRRDRLDDARAAFSRALVLGPDDANNHYNLGNILKAQEKPADAVAAFARALELDPAMVTARVNMGVALAQIGRLDDAIAAYRGALELDPDLPEALLNLGDMLLHRGSLDDARAAFQRTVEARPSYAEAYRHLGVLKTYDPGDAMIGHMERLAEACDPGGDDAIQLHFALGKAYDDAGDYDTAFARYAKANRLKRKTLDYDAARAEHYVTRIIEAFPADRLANPGGHGSPSDAPVFIIGMPRAGTTLVEQILASHPRAHGAGELANLGRMVGDLGRRTGTGQAYPECLGGAAPGLWRELGEDYLDGVPAEARSAGRFSDKMPSNYRYIGLIRLMLPNARIIHCTRDPLDTCLSCFRTLFVDGQEFTYDLAELGRHFGQCERLMRHWARVVPDMLLDVRYEDVVGDVETMARRIIDFCGLEWDDACLAFHQTERIVRTASAAQVRRPIYATSVGKWRRYQAHLGPLVEALGQHPPSAAP